MYFKDKIKKDMNEILHGNLADTARKHFGRISDDWDDREKENALADVYDKLQSELDKTEDTLKRPWSRENTVKPLPYRPTDEPQIEKLPGNVTRENPVPMPYRPGDNYREKRLREIDKEIKEVMHGDTDEWLKKNGLFVSKMPENKREKLLGYMYDRLNEERDKIVKNNSLAYKTKTQPERTSPVKTNNATTLTGYMDNLKNEKTAYEKTNTPQINQFSNKTETEPEEMVSFALKPRDDSKLDIDSFKGNGFYKNLRMPAHSMEVKSLSEQDETDRINSELDNSIAYIQSLEEPTQEKMSDAYFRQHVFDSTDRDTFLDRHQNIYGYYYDMNMSEEEKQDLYEHVRTMVEEDSNNAQKDAKGLWGANDAIKWIKKNVYNVQNGNADINFTYNTLLEQQAYAWANYANTGSEYALGVACMWDLAEEKFLNDNDVGQGNFFTNTLMSKLPGKINELKAGAKTGLVGAGVGGTLGGTAGALTGWSKGYEVGTTLDDFNKNTGIACKALVDAGIESSLAVKGAKIIASLGIGVGAIFETICSSLVDEKVKDEAIEEIVNVYVEVFGDKVGEYVHDQLTQTYIGKYGKS